MAPITFTEEDLKVWDYPHTDANVAGYTLHNILIDTGSSTDILFIKPFNSMNMDRRLLELKGNLCMCSRERKSMLLGKTTFQSPSRETKVKIEIITFVIVNAAIKQSYIGMEIPSPFGIVMTQKPNLVKFFR